MLIRVLAVGLTGMSLVVGQTIFDKPAVSQTSDKCSKDVKLALKNAKWKMNTDFSNGAGSWTITTDVAADGAMTIATRRGPLKIRCDDKEISFDWKEDSSKRYTMTLQNDGSFSGSRTGSHNDYNASLTKKM